MATMHEEAPSSMGPKKMILLIVVAVAIGVSLLFQMFWNPDKPTAADDKEIKKQAMLQSLMEPQMAVLYSLEPTGQVDPSKAQFHGFQINKEIKVNPEDTADVALEFKDAADSYNETITETKCFNPRYGLKVTKNGKTTDFVLSYECFSMKAYDEKSHEYSFGAAGNPVKLIDVMKAADAPIPEGAEPVETVEEN